LLYWGGLGFLNSQDIIPGILTTGDNMPKWVLSFNLIGKELNLIWPSGNILFPINKPLWTSSFTLLTAGIAMLELAIFVVLVDVKFEDRKWRVMTAFGKNAMFAFLLHGFIKIPKCNVCFPSTRIY